MPVAPDGSELPYADQGGDSEDFARSMLDLINEWRQVETDEEDLMMLEQVSSLVQRLLARNAKEAQDAMMGKLSPRIMAQAYGG